MGQDMRTQGSRAISPERFELTTFFEGHTRAWGLVEDRFGRMRRRFNVEMHGAWRGDVFELAERFVYDTGEEETRTWRISPGRDGRFTATCADCVGGAIGVAVDDSVRMSYRFRLKITGRDVVVTFDDRLYRMGDGVAVNRATISKWGFKLAELALFFERHCEH